MIFDCCVALLCLDLGLAHHSVLRPVSPLSAVAIAGGRSVSDSGSRKKDFGRATRLRELVEPTNTDPVAPTQLKLLVWLSQSLPLFGYFEPCWKSARFGVRKIPSFEEFGSCSVWRFDES